MLSQTFSLVENGEIIESGIQRGSRYKGKKYGAEDPDEVYISLGLYPEIGERPDYDQATQTIVGPTYTFNEGNQGVDKAWLVEDKPLAEIKVILQENNREACKEHILANYPIEIQLSMNAGVYATDEMTAYQTFITDCVAEENRVFDLLEAATTVAELQAIPEPTWPEVA